MIFSQFRYLISVSGTSAINHTLVLVVKMLRILAKWLKHVVQIPCMNWETGPFCDIGMQNMSVGKNELSSSAFLIVNSLTRLGNLLDFGQLFKAFGNN